MNKEIGKWFLDVAKYIITAYLLAKMFVKVDSVFSVIGAIATMVALFALGVYFFKKDNKDNKNKEK